jgi:heterotetrameric sarcosine oxidase gamma subunit
MTPDPASPTGVVATPAPPHLRFSIEARSGQSGVLVARLQAAFGAPDSPLGAIEILPIGPGRVHAIVTGTNRAREADRLFEVIGEIASILDISDGFTTTQISGPKASETLTKLVRIDLAGFGPGSVTHTELHGMNVQLRRTPAGSFELAVSRSFGDSLLDAIAHAAAGFGFTRS